MKVAVPLTKNILAPLGITSAASAIDAGIQKKIHGWHYENCSSSWKFCWKESLKQLKMKQKNKKENS